MYRISADIAPQFYSTMYNLQAMLPYTNYSRPGCWYVVVHGCAPHGITPRKSSNQHTNVIPMLHHVFSDTTTLQLCMFPQALPGHVDGRAQGAVARRDTVSHSSTHANETKHKSMEMHKHINSKSISCTHAHVMLTQVTFCGLVHILQPLDSWP